MSPHRPSGTFLTRLRKLAAGERGASSPFLVLGAITVFGAVSVGFVGGLTAAMQTMQQQKVNTALAGVTSSVAMKEANLGYPVVSALPESSEITLKVGNAEVSAIRVISKNPTEQTAQVTIQAGRYIDGGFYDPAECDEKPANCVSATETAISSLSQTFPETEGVTLLNPSANIPASTEATWRDVAVGAGTVVALGADGSLWAWGRNQYGEAANGSVNAVTAPARIDTGDLTFSKVAAGTTSMYALDVDGGLWAWGANSAGQLGNGSTTALRSPTKISPDTRWVDVDAASDRACGVTSTGSIKCWGTSTVVWPSGTTSSYTPRDVFSAGESASTNTPRKFTQVSVGVSHQVAIDAAGDAYAWGSGARGALGNGSTTSLTAPTKVTSDSFSAMFIAVDAGESTTYAIDAYGRLYAWGANSLYQLGDSTTTDRTSPVRVATNVLFQDVSSGSSGTTHAAGYAVSRSGVAYSWGSAATTGTLGKGSTTVHPTPTEIADSATFVSVTTSPRTTTVWALDTTHRLWSWGAGGNGIWGDGSSATATYADAAQTRLRSGGGVTVSQVAAGTNHTVALSTSGAIWTWGRGSAGQLGNGETADKSSSVAAQGTYSNTPVDVAVGSGFTIVTGKLGTIVSAGTATDGEIIGTTSRTAPAAAGTTQYSAISSGVAHSVAIERSTGVAVSWGRSTYGQVGNGNTAKSTSPIKVKGLPSAKIVQVAAGTSFSAALDVDGNVWAWGRNNFGQLGDGSTEQRLTATQVPLSVKIVSIAAGAEHMLAIDESGETWAWGRNDFGQVGIGSASQSRAIPVKITTPAPLVAVAAGASHSVGLTADGRLVAWGGQTVNESGLGVAETLTPTLVSSVSSTAFRTVVSHHRQTFAVDTAGDLWAWGTNADGNLGRATSPAPVKLVTGLNIISVDASVTHAAFVTAAGKVFVTGAGESGQLGRGSTTSAASFTEVATWNTTIGAALPAYAKGDEGAAQATFAQVDAGGDATGAIDTEGHLWMWGAGANNQTGSGTTTSENRPQLVASAMKFVEVSVGERHVVARAADGSAWTFGASATAANGRTFALPTPARIGLGSPAVAVAAGTTHTAVLAGGGKALYSWGQNTSGQLGVTAGAARTLPAKRTVTSGSGVTAGSTYTLVLDGSSKVTRIGVAPWGDTNPFTGQYADLNVAGPVAIGAVRTGRNPVQVYGVATGSAAPTTFNTVNASTFTNADVGSGHAVALDVNGSVWTWGVNVHGQLGRSGSSATPNLVPAVGDSARKVFERQAAPAVTTTTWQIGTIDAGASGSVQVNVSAGMPMLSVVVLCDDGTRQHMAKPLASSGEFSYANISVEDLDGCGTPTIAAILGGSPVSVRDVKVAIVPLVYSAEATTR